MFYILKRLGIYDAMDSHRTLSALIRKYDLKVGVEIGVLKAFHSEYILDHTNVTLLIGVDPYRSTESYKKVGGELANDADSIVEGVYQEVLARMKRFGERFKLIRATSEEAKWSEPLDFVYIDGDHSYEAVLIDIKKWYPLLRTGGIIAGHDYSPKWQGVIKAVQEYFTDRSQSLVINEMNAVWWIQK